MGRENRYHKAEGRRRLSDSLRRDEAQPTDREPLDPLSEGLARAFQNRGLELNLPPTRQAIDAQDRARKSEILHQLAAEKDKATQAQRKRELEAQRRAEAEAFEAQLNRLGMGTIKAQEADQPPSIALNSGQLLDRAAGQGPPPAADLFRTAAEAQGMTAVPSVADALRRAAEGQ